MSKSEINTAAETIVNESLKASKKKYVWIAAGTVVACVAGYLINRYIGLDASDIIDVASAE